MMQFSGIMKQGGAYDVPCKDGSKKVMISFTVADEFGNTFACQMWPDDQQHAQLAGMIDKARMQPVQFTVASYTSRMRKFKDGTEKPQTNFIVTGVVFPNLQAA